VRPFIGQNVTIQTDANTRLLLKSGSTVTVISFADLQVDQAVSVQGSLTNTVWKAQRITVGAAIAQVH
jgi:hypothetical protein